MKILALDPGRYTGFAFSGVKDQVQASGVWDLGPAPAARPGNLARELREAVDFYRPEKIAYEFATMGGDFAGPQMRLNELAGVIKAVAHECGLPAWEFPIGTWKKLALGNGAAKKPAVIRSLRTYYGIEVTNENQADAIGILLAAQQGPPPESRKRQVKALEKKLLASQPLSFGGLRRK